METWQIVVQLILLPTSIVAVLAFVMREIFKSYLSMDVEKYKTSLQTDLESHKAKLKAEHDLKQFEFQTKYSLFHQKQADAIEQLYAYLAGLEIHLQRLACWVEDSRFGDKQEFVAKTNSNLDDLCEYFDKKRIYFDDETATRVIAIIEVAILLKQGLALTGSYNEIQESLQTQARNIHMNQIRPVMSQLEKKFRNLLSTGNTSKES